ncbi:hypothetical protein OJ996_03255 [Luteolibacter sp. GHJ8]|uniref:Type II secretion system protein GspG C-terminal domain-containing protein n=1 Tax=Luteolibacter rhizosphaerae TaxID=2989719 RepID=A0ABT3FYA6_9BACT|nr:hypothetical protein [Luteolibacter rhizosphaerae]MCW1912576.1 hypothetical protein [Luteolibacter rhizosphaerae]
MFLLLLVGAIIDLLPLLELPFRLVFGCLFHFWNLVPPMLSQWKAVASPFVSLAIILPLAHHFFRWFAISRGRTLWRFSHSLAIVALLFAGSAAAIAMSGITHQAAWMADVPWWNHRGRGEVSEAMSRIRDLQVAMAEFYSEHGRYPESLSELESRIEGFGRASTMPAGLAGIPESFVYLKPETMEAAAPPLPILVSPLLGSGRVAVGFNDHSVKALHVEDLESILNRGLRP